MKTVTKQLAVDFLDSSAHKCACFYYVNKFILKAKVFHHHPSLIPPCLMYSNYYYLVA